MATFRALSRSLRRAANAGLKYLRHQELQLPKDLTHIRLEQNISLTRPSLMLHHSFGLLRRSPSRSVGAIPVAASQMLSEEHGLPGLSHPGFQGHTFPQGLSKVYSRYLHTHAKMNTESYDSYVTETGTTLYFDTHKLVKRLEASGFSPSQSEVITAALIEIMSGSAGAVSKSMVTRSELAQMELRVNGLIEALRKDMVILEKSEFLMLKQESENLKNEVQQLNRLLKDELLKVKSNLTLDLSLEKGRHKEDFTLQDQKIKDVHNRIDTEIARIRTDLEAQKLDLIKYLVGSFLSVVTVMIGIWRFMKM